MGYNVIRCLRSFNPIQWKEGESRDTYPSSQILSIYKSVKQRQGTNCQGSYCFTPFTYNPKLAHLGNFKHSAGNQDFSRF